MSDSIAERALGAFKAEQEQARLNNEALIVAARSRAVNAILLAAEKFELKIDVDDIEPAVCSAKITSPHFAKWWIIVPIDDDLGLKIESGGDGAAEVTADYPDQLYWDLPPGVEKMTSRGGTYACYGLSKSHGGDSVHNLAELGKQIVRTREARDKWRAKHDERRNEDGT